MHKHIIWDWNGTLLDDVWLVVDIINGLLRRRELPEIEENKYREVFEFPVRNYYRRLGFDFEREPFEIPANEFVKEYKNRRNECNLQEGAKDVIKHLSNKGFEQHVLSAYQQDELEEAIENFGIKDYFSNICGLDNHHADGKVEVGRNLVAEINDCPENMVLIGDTTHDYHVSEDIGIECILISSGHNNTKKLNSCDTKVISNLTELKYLTN